MIPRRASVTDLTLAQRKKLRVTVDGEMFKAVAAYDQDEGWVDHLLFGDDGYPLHNGEDFVTQRVFGKVEAFEV